MRVRIKINDESELNLYKVGDKGTVLDTYSDSLLVTLDKKYNNTTISYEFFKNEVETMH